VTGTEVTTGRPALARWRRAVTPAFGLGGITISAWGPRLPAIKADLGIGTATIGLLLAGVTVGALLGLLASTPVLHRMGSRRAIAGALLLTAAAMTVMGLALIVGSVPLVAVAFVITGLGIGVLDVLISVEGSAVERAAGRTLMPMMHAAWSIGAAAGSGIGAACAALRITPSEQFIAEAALIAAAGLGAAAGIPGGSRGPAGAAQDRRARLRQWLRGWLDWRLLLIGLVMLGVELGEGSANSWLTLAVRDDHGQTPSASLTPCGSLSPCSSPPSPRPARSARGRPPPNRPRSHAPGPDQVGHIYRTDPWRLPRPRPRAAGRRRGAGLSRPVHQGHVRGEIVPVEGICVIRAGVQHYELYRHASDDTPGRGLTEAGLALAFTAGGFGGLVLPGDMPHDLLAAQRLPPGTEDTHGHEVPRGRLGPDHRPGPGLGGGGSDRRDGIAATGDLRCAVSHQPTPFLALSLASRPAGCAPSPSSPARTSAGAGARATSAQAVVPQSPVMRQRPNNAEDPTCAEDLGISRYQNAPYKPNPPR
jgi:hypothetical protein